MIDSISHGTPPEEIQEKVAHRRDTISVARVRVEASCFLSRCGGEDVTTPDTETRLSQTGLDDVRDTWPLLDEEELLKTPEYRGI